MGASARRAEAAVIARAQQADGVAIQHAWLQKHPSPVASGGDFHWYPQKGDRDLRAELVERVRGLDPPAIVWRLEPGRVVWARAFTAHAPLDGRRYVGLAVTVAESAGAAVRQLLGSIDVEPAAPWTADVAIESGMVAASRPASALASQRGPTALDRHDLIALARTVIAGGSARVSVGDHLIAALAMLDAVMPPSIGRRPRWGACVQGPVAESDDPVAELAVGACLEPLSGQALGWQLLCELATSRGETLDEVVHESGAPSVLTDEERAVVRRGAATPAGALFAAEPNIPLGLIDTLHLWGRGRFDLCSTAGTITRRLADAVALSMLAGLIADGDGRRAIADARWSAIVPATRRAALFETLIERAPSLRTVVEG